MPRLISVLDCLWASFIEASLALFWDMFYLRWERKSKICMILTKSNKALIVWTIPGRLAVCLFSYSHGQDPDQRGKTRHGEGRWEDDLEPLLWWRGFLEDGRWRRCWWRVLSRWLVWRISVLTSWTWLYDVNRIWVKDCFWWNEEEAVLVKGEWGTPMNYDIGWDI